MTCSSTWKKTKPAGWRRWRATWRPSTACGPRSQAVGSADASLRNAFSAAGINQTRHQILLHVDVYTGILLPGFTASTKVSNEIAVAETVIVGSVPETYTYFSTAPEEQEQYAQDYIMNKG